MAKEVLAIPESKLAEVIKVIRSGLKTIDPRQISNETRERLTDWCNDEEEYLKRLNEP